MANYGVYSILGSPREHGSTIASCLIVNNCNGKHYYAKSEVGYTLAQSYDHSLKEKMGLVLYAMLGVKVPDSMILKLPIVYTHKLYSNSLFGIDENRQDSYYLCTEIVGDQLIEMATLIDNNMLVKLLVAGHVINDPDVFGSNMNNLRIDNASKNKTVYKIDAGEAFSKINDEELNQIRVMTQGSDTCIDINKLDIKMQDSFNCQIRKVIANEDMVSTNLKYHFSKKYYPTNQTQIQDCITLLKHRFQYLRKTYK